MRDPHILSFKIFTLLRLPFASTLFSNPTFPVVICCFFCYLSFKSKHELFLRPMIYHTMESWVFEENLSPPPPSSIFFREVFALSSPLTRHAASFSIVDNQNNDRLDFVPVSDESRATNNRKKLVIQEILKWCDSVCTWLHSTVLPTFMIPLKYVKHHIRH